MTDYVCEKCREDLSKDAERCPQCGHNPARKHLWWARIHGILTIVLMLSVAGIPLGLITMWKGSNHRKAAKNPSPGVEV